MPFRMYLFGNTAACRAGPQRCPEQAPRGTTVALIVFPEAAAGWSLDADTLAATSIAESGNLTVC